MQRRGFPSNLNAMATGIEETALPQRPRLLPGLGVFERRRDELQIGLDSRHAVVATNLSPGVMNILQNLDGRRHLSSLLELAEGEHAARLRDVLTGLAERGLVEDAATSRPPTPAQDHDLWSVRLGRPRQDTATQREHCAVRIHGGGRLASAVAIQLAAAGIGHLDIRVDGLVTGDDLGCGLAEGDLGRHRRHAVATAVHRITSTTRTTRLRGNRHPDLVLLTDAIVPAPEVVTDLVADGLPHLAIRVRDGVGIIGPLVVPGRSSCLRCADLHRTALDPCWPRVAGQLAGRFQTAELPTVYGTAALAVGQALRLVHPASTPPPTWNGTVELDCYTGRVQHREWPPHPQCTCGAPPPYAAE